jgi:hypothetical protein
MQTGSESLGLNRFPVNVYVCSDLIAFKIVVCLLIPAERFEEITIEQNAKGETHSRIALFWH